MNEEKLTRISIRPWTEEDLLHLRNLNTDAVWGHLGGPETEEKLLARHQLFLSGQPGKLQMFVILYHGEPAGNVGYWEREWQSRQVYETGWMVLPEFQGKGVASSGTALMLDRLGNEVPAAVVHAFPHTDNAASNAICRKLGFTLIGETTFEFPKGVWKTSNDWRIALP